MTKRVRDGNWETVLEVSIVSVDGGVKDTSNIAQTIAAYLSTLMGVFSPSFSHADDASRAFPILCLKRGRETVRFSNERIEGITLLLSVGHRCLSLPRLRSCSQSEWKQGNKCCKCNQRQCRCSWLMRWESFPRIFTSQFAFASLLPS